MSSQNEAPEKEKNTERNTDQQIENKRAGEVRFGRFGPLTGQNGASKREKSTGNLMRSRTAG